MNMMENIIRVLVRRIVTHIAESRVENGKKGAGELLRELVPRESEC